MQCQELFDLVGAALEGGLIETAFVRTTGIEYQGCTPAYRADVDSWRSDIYFRTGAVKLS
jgi:hypothetical protein